MTEIGTKGLIHGLVNLMQFCAGADPTSKFRAAISVIFGIQVSLRVHYCKRDEVYFRTAVTKQYMTEWAHIANVVLRIVKNYGE